MLKTIGFIFAVIAIISLTVSLLLILYGIWSYKTRPDAFNPGPYCVITGEPCIHPSIDDQKCCLSCDVARNFEVQEMERNKKDEL